MHGAAEEGLRQPTPIIDCVDEEEAVGHVLTRSPRPHPSPHPSNKACRSAQQPSSSTSTISTHTGMESPCGGMLAPTRTVRVLGGHVEVAAWLGFVAW